MAFDVRHGNAVDMIMVLCPIQIMEMPYQRLETGIWLFSQNLETFSVENGQKYEPNKNPKSNSINTSDSRTWGGLSSTSPLT